MENDWNVIVYHCPFGTIIRNHYTGGEVVQKKTRTHWSEEKRKEYAHDIAQKRHAQKMRRQALLKATEQTTNKEIVYRFHQMNRAIQTHMMYFSLLSAHALEHKWRIGYESYQQRLSADDMEDVQSKLQRWLAKHGEGVMAAISIGRGKRGYAYIYALYTSDDEDKMIDFHIKLVQYMREGMKRKKRRGKDKPKSIGFKLVECRPYERDPYAFLESRYCRELKDIMDADDSLIDELAYMIRSSFALAGREKTLKTGDAVDIVKAHGVIMGLFDDSLDTGVSPSTLMILNKAGSVVGEWRDEEEDTIDEDSFEF